jgi:hypothetical protein
LPLIVSTDGPGSIVEQLKIVEPLTNPTAHGARIGRFSLGDPVNARVWIFKQAYDHRMGCGAHAQGTHGFFQSEASLYHGQSCSS